MQVIGDIVNAIINLHPWHSPVVHFPIGFTACALLFLLGAFYRGKKSLAYAAFLALAFAAVASAVAGILGIRDNIVRFDGGAPLIPAKIILAAILLALTAVTAVSGLRRVRADVPWDARHRAIYLTAAVVSFCLTLVLGFLGGVILYGL